MHEVSRTAVIGDRRAVFGPAALFLGSDGGGFEARGPLTLASGESDEVTIRVREVRAEEYPDPADLEWHVSFFVNDPYVGVLHLRVRARWDPS